jgi:hypothetical protein
MNDIIVDNFQSTVAESLMRHKSIIDILTKLTESNSRINRAVAKSVTSCGCVSISAHKQKLPDDASLENVSKLLTSQVDGKLCEGCREVLEQEIGTNLYYIAALCDALGLNLFDVMLEEYKKVETLGKFTLL